ncbi:hypothetical protein VNO80_29840 [Phaseolus coccineus]|uniref:Uncharacterized protein n=1 Tax=Phaseolus coccineus TaxID=3886 RepID=A0AAN9QF93_PHACN
MGFSYSNRNNMVSNLRQESNEESNFFSRNYGYGQTLVLYHSKLFINLDGSTITEDSFNNKGKGNQDFSSAHIRTKQTYPSPSPAAAIHTVSDTPNQHHSFSNEGISAYGCSFFNST